ncbi:MAG: DUF3179 domain-containing protein [Chloroflexi bacterium]|nr:DUF3179 domain-containing protein [Chloroflexota bacterium]
MVFGRTVQGKTLTFGVSGLLRQSNLVMWDRETESWWQQGTAQAIVGTLVGTTLEQLPSQVVAYRDFKEAYPGGKVLVGPRGSHYANPYEEYDTSSWPFLFSDAVDPCLPVMERVLGIRYEGAARAYPFRELAVERVIHDAVGRREMVIFYEPSTASSLDQPRVSESRAVGAASAFIPQVRGKHLTFQWRDGAFKDNETGSCWSILGQAMGGPLAGERLPPLLHVDSLWFYWAAIYPETEVYRGS